MSVQWQTTFGRLGILSCLLGLAGACSPAGSAEFVCDPDNGGINLSEGFCATVFADELGQARHLAVAANGDVYVARLPVRRREEDGNLEVSSSGGLIALRDTNGDGKADIQADVSDVAGTGVAIYGGYLYYSSNTEIYRLEMTPGALVPEAEPEAVVTGFPSQGQHASKPLTFDDRGNLYVTVGAPSNACQQQMRTPGSPGLDPCPQRQWQAAIWRFSVNGTGQTQEESGVRYASGIRNAVALDWNRSMNGLYALQHGRDALGQLFPDRFDLQQSAELPGEEFLQIGQGDDFGWPYCYYDPVQKKKVLGPEYGGDGQQVGRCASAKGPMMAFPAHWAPNDLLFYRDGSFPERFEGGAFIAFHGSWNRMPFQQQGYKVVFVPFRDGLPSAPEEVFADGFPQNDDVRTPGDAVYRPVGLAQGPDGSLYISDSRRGRIWRIRAEEQS